MHASQLSDGAVARTFVLAGNARVTLVSERTGARFTYRVRQSKPKTGDDRPPVHFVALLSGPDNDSDFQFLGTIFPDGAFRTSPKSRISSDAPSAKAFAYAWRFLAQGDLPPHCEVWHEGRCGKCGRTLTVPESIATGLGPVCAERGLL